MLPRLVRAAAHATEQLQKATEAQPRSEKAAGAGESRRSALDRLAAAQRHLLHRPSGALDVRSEAGGLACTLFLELLEAAAAALRAPAAPRGFREAYRGRFREVFPGQARHYSKDLLRICVSPEAPFFMNGTGYNFAAEMVESSKRLRARWGELGELLAAWGRGRGRAQPSLAMSEIRDVLGEFDVAWAGFEQCFVAEMTLIEEQAKSLLLRAAEQERALRRLEERGATGEDSEEHCRARRELAETIAQLNAAANTAGQGRDDLDAEVLERAEAVLAECRREERRGLKGKVAKATAMMSYLAGRVVDAFKALCKCIREAGRSPSIVSPNLSKVPGLVTRLQAWEEAWQLGRLYVLRPRVLEGLCRAAAEVQAAQTFAPDLADYCATCDAELFVILPRIVWLCFLHVPGTYSELLRAHLPHRISSDPPVSGQGTGCLELQGELQAFADAFVRLRGRLLPALDGGSGPGAEEALWQLLVRQAVAGPSAAPAGPLAALPKALQTAAAEFANRLEQWSMELQRHCPNDWNECCAVLLKCLAES